MIISTISSSYIANIDYETLVKNIQYITSGGYPGILITWDKKDSTSGIISTWINLKDLIHDLSIGQTSGINLTVENNTSGKVLNAIVLSDDKTIKINNDNKIYVNQIISSQVKELNIIIDNLNQTINSASANAYNLASGDLTTFKVTQFTNLSTKVDNLNIISAGNYTNGIITLNGNISSIIITGLTIHGNYLSAVNPIASGMFNIYTDKQKLSGYNDINKSYTLIDDNDEYGKQISGQKIQLASTHLTIGNDQGYISNTWLGNQDWYGKQWLVYSNGKPVQPRFYINVGQKNICRGWNSLVVGTKSNIADSAPNSFAVGYKANANGCASMANGGSIYAYGPFSHAEGRYTSAYNYNSHAEGVYNYTKGFASHVEGWNTFVLSTDINNQVISASHAEGYFNYIYGSFSHAEGYNNKISGQYSHIEGKQNIITNINGSHAQGYKTFINNNYSHTEGIQTSGIGLSVHAEGYKTQAIGNYSHVEGQQTQALREYSHAEGLSCITNGIGSHAEGLGTIVNAYFQTAVGKYNNPVQAAFVVGIGDGNKDTGPLNRKNALIVGWNGITQILSAINVPTGNIDIINNKTINNTQGISIGNNNTITGNFGLAIGKDINTNGKKGVLVLGEGTEAKGYWQFVGGKYNTLKDIPVIIGNGTSIERKNIYQLDWSGNEWISGSLNASNYIIHDGNNNYNLNSANGLVRLDNNCKIPTGLYDKGVDGNYLSATNPSGNGKFTFAGNANFTNDISAHNTIVNGIDVYEALSSINETLWNIIKA